MNNMGMATRMSMFISTARQADKIIQGGRINNMQVAIGDVLEGKVTGITKFGAFVELDEGKTGMVHISEVSTAYVEDISQYLEEGQVVKVKIINITDEGKISLSIKKAMPPQPREARPQQGARPSGGFSGGGSRSVGGGGGFHGSRNSSDGRGGGGHRFQPSKPFNPQNMSSYEWTPRKASDGGTFEDMMNKFKQASDDKMSDLKKARGDVGRRSTSKKPKPE